jgi:bifunctional UDP-N-acetylglucosamine pyrophosphorylase/glucosamine-1-phosphate N-acetyltransferase
MSLPITVVVLAAGKGTRMKSPRPKVLHRLAGRSMIDHVLAVAADLLPERAVVVLAPDMADVAAAVARAPQPATIVLQEPQLGTGHALMAARDHLPSSGDVLVLYADTPLLTVPTLTRLLEARRAAAAAVAVPGLRSPGASWRRSSRSAMPTKSSSAMACAMPGPWHSMPPGSACCWTPWS